VFIKNETILKLKYISFSAELFSGFPFVPNSFYLEKNDLGKSMFEMEDLEVRKF